MSYNQFTYVTIVILCICIGYFFEPPAPLTKKVLFRALEGVSLKDSLNGKGKNVALGFNSNLDYIIDAAVFIEKLNITITGDANDEVDIKTLGDFNKVFSHYFKMSSAGERIIAEDALWKSMLEVTKSHYSEMFIGGNAAIMSTHFSTLGFKTCLAGPVGGNMKQLLKRKNVYPAIEVLGKDIAHDTPDEIHIILEYKEGAKIGGMTATKSNRFILTRDFTNSRLVGLEDMEMSLGIVKPHAVIISGLHLLEMWSAENQNSRLNEMASRILIKEPPSTVVHLELASMTNSLLLRNIIDIVTPHVDSIGLNEQELVFLYQVLGGKFKDDSENNDKINASQHKTVDHSISCAEYSKTDITSNPINIKAVANALAFIYNNIQSNNVSSGHLRHLTRIHFHTHSFHFIAVLSGSRWKRPSASVAFGSITATFEACKIPNEELLHGNDLDLPGSLDFSAVNQHGKGKLEIEENNPVVQWSVPISNKKTLVFHAAPVLVCKLPKNTVGLGDAISSRALSIEL